MGLGKTVMTLSLIADEKYEGLNLIIVPVTVLRQWQDEIIKHCGKKIKVFEYHSDSKKRKTTDLYKYDIVITTYQTFGTEYRNYESKKEKGEMWLFDY
jgi:SNF2 family DNA or RNA helicase